MPLVAMWKCDRDNAMFENKKDADDHDKMLELAEQFTALAQCQLKNIDEGSAEKFGLLLAKNKQLIIQACKGKPEVLDGVGNPDSSVTKLATAS